MPIATDVVDAMSDERRSLIQGLRDLADFLESNPSAPTPMAGRFDVFTYTKEMFAKAAKAVGGKLTKQDYSAVMTLRKEFGPIQYDLNCDRELICERIVTGKRIVPAVEAVQQREEEVVEWRCGTVLS